MKKHFLALVISGLSNLVLAEVTPYGYPVLQKPSPYGANNGNTWSQPVSSANLPEQPSNSTPSPDSVVYSNWANKVDLEKYKMDGELCDAEKWEKGATINNKKVMIVTTQDNFNKLQTCIKGFLNQRTVFVEALAGNLISLSNNQNQLASVYKVEKNYEDYAYSLLNKFDKYYFAMIQNGFSVVNLNITALSQMDGKAGLKATEAYDYTDSQYKIVFKQIQPQHNTIINNALSLLKPKIQALAAEQASLQNKKTANTTAPVADGLGLQNSNTLSVEESNMSAGGVAKKTSVMTPEEEAAKISAEIEKKQEAEKMAQYQKEMNNQIAQEAQNKKMMSIVGAVLFGLLVLIGVFRKKIITAMNKFMEKKKQNKVEVETEQVEDTFDLEAAIEQQTEVDKNNEENKSVEPPKKEIKPSSVKWNGNKKENNQPLPEEETTIPVLEEVQVEEFKPEEPKDEIIKPTVKSTKWTPKNKKD